MLRSIWKLLKILFVILIIFGIVSMIVSLVVTFTLSSKMAIEFPSDQGVAQAQRQLISSMPTNLGSQKAPGTIVSEA